MAGESGQKSKRHTLKTVVGQLTAFSHVFKTKPRVAFVELMHDYQLCHIALRQHRALYKNLTLGKVYKVTHLQARQMLYTDGSVVHLFETSPESSFVLLLDSGQMLPEPGFSTYEGKVVESCDSLGIYQLHDGVQLCLAFLMKYTDVPVPCVGQSVSVYNAHWWENETDGKHHIVLCGRSCIVVHGQSKGLTSSNCVLMDINHNCTYKDLLWLKKQLTQFEEKFNSDFLIENGILSESVSELQQTLLIKTVNIHYPSKERAIEERYFSREFLSSPHQCVVLKSNTFVGMYTSLNELWKQAASRYKPFSKSWNYRITHHTTGLVGFLSTSISNGYWTLSDATQSISCVLTGNVEDLVTLHGAIVLLMNYTVVAEVCQDVSFIYIHFAVKDARVVHTCGLMHENAYRLKETDVGMACHSEMCTSENRTKNKQRLRNFCVEDILGYDLLSKETVVPSKYTWVVVVHHKTTAAKISLYAPSMCCVLVSLIGTIREVADGCYSTQHQYLLLTGKLLQFVPLLRSDSTYLLSFPDSTPCHMLPQPCRLKLKLSVLPDVWGVCLPQESTFLLIGTQRPEFFDLQFNSYNVGDKNLSEEVGQKELVNVEGIICDRLHVDVKYDSEKILSMPGYGIPGMKNIVLKLRATPGCGEVSLYLTKWSCRAYPYGLIPGARICAMFVTKHKSHNNCCTYFQATEFTRIEVLHIPQVMEISTADTCSSPLDSWGDSCILAKEAEHAAVGSVLLGIFSTVKILKLTAATSCSHCSSFFRSGCCVGCNSYPASPKLSVTAVCCIEDVFGKILIFMKDDQVCQLLGLSKPYLDVLTKLISQDGYEIELPQSQWNPEDPIGKQVLQALLKAVDKHQLRFHILCRKMKLNKPDTRYADLPKLYCLALQKPRTAFSYSVFKTGVSQC